MTVVTDEHELVDYHQQRSRHNLAQMAASGIKTVLGLEKPYENDFNGVAV